MAIHDPDHWAATVPKANWSWNPLLSDGLDDALALILSSRCWYEGMFEFLAFSGQNERRRGIPPHWLSNVAEQLADQRCERLPRFILYIWRELFGAGMESPGAYRLAQRTSAAISATVLASRPYCAVAHELGFSDQSHMARSVRSSTGHSLSQLRKLSLKALDGQCGS